MKKELEVKLIEKYPVILQDMYGDPRYTCMAWGIECNDGWYDLLDQLMGFLQFHTEHNNYPQVIATQIKEKYGTLSFYKKYEIKEDSRGTEFLEGAIAFTCNISGSICEQCGEHGKVRGESWLYCACDKCDNKMKGEV